MGTAITTYFEVLVNVAYYAIFKDANVCIDPKTPLGLDSIMPQTWHDVEFSARSPRSPCQPENSAHVVPGYHSVQQR